MKPLGRSKATGALILRPVSKRGTITLTRALEAADKVLRAAPVIQPKGYE